MFEQKSGSATLTLGYDSGKVVASASCDSLQQLVFDLQEELHQARDDTERQEITTTPVQPTFFQRIKLFLIGFLTGFILSKLIKFFKR